MQDIPVSLLKDIQYLHNYPCNSVLRKKISRCKAMLRSTELESAGQKQKAVPRSGEALQGICRMKKPGAANLMSIFMSKKLLLKSECFSPDTKLVHATCPFWVINTILQSQTRERNKPSPLPNIN